MGIILQGKQKLTEISIPKTNKNSADKVLKTILPRATKSIPLFYHLGFFALIIDLKLFAGKTSNFFKLSTNYLPMVLKLQCTRNDMNQMFSF